MDLSALSDEDLLELVAERRDGEAFEVLYRRYSRAVYAVVRRMVGAGYEVTIADSDAGRAGEVRRQTGAARVSVVDLSTEEGAHECVETAREDAIHHREADAAIDASSIDKGLEDRAIRAA